MTIERRGPFSPIYRTVRKEKSVGARTRRSLQLLGSKITDTHFDLQPHPSDPNLDQVVIHTDWYGEERTETVVGSNIQTHRIVRFNRIRWSAKKS